MGNGLLNRWDSKWAHPDMVEDGFYTLKEMTDPQDIRKMTSEELEEKRRSQAKAVHELIMESGNWKDYYTEHGCPEERGAPPVHIMVQMPEKKREKEKFPVVFIIPGGGLTGAGTAETAASCGGHMIEQSGVQAAMVCMDYRIAPANPYPAAVNDCHAVYMWMLENAEKLGFDTDKVIIYGESTGGHLALCLTARLMRYQWENGIMPRGLILQVPAINDLDFTTSNRYSFINPDTGKVECWDHDCVENAFRIWLGERYGDTTLSAEAVPNRLTPEEVKGFPPVWIPAQAEFEPSRDFIYQFAKMLHEADVFCDLHVWGGTTHLMCNGRESDLSQRIQSISGGALRDAIRYDFRRLWRNQ